VQLPAAPSHTGRGRSGGIAASSGVEESRAGGSACHEN
jgi:hypothetical protein